MKKLLLPLISLTIFLAACSSKEDAASKETPAQKARKITVEEVSVLAATSKNCAGYQDYLANCKTFYCEEKQESDSDSSLHFKLVKPISAEACVYKSGVKTLGGSLNAQTDCMLTQAERLQLAGYLRTKTDFADKLKKEEGVLPDGSRYDETLEGRPVINPLYSLVQSKACTQTL